MDNKNIINNMIKINRLNNKKIFKIEIKWK